MAKAQFSEKLTDTNISKVIGLLNAEKPITKKVACEMLGIAYNTSRLSSIIEKFLEAEKFEQDQREKKRYKAATSDEISFIVQSYLSGDPVSDISKRIYRSGGFVSNILNRVGCPKREIGHSYFHPSMLPDECIKEAFQVGEQVFSSRYDSIATIEAEQDSKRGKVYRIWLKDEKWQQYAYQPWWELGGLEHLKQYGI